MIHVPPSGYCGLWSCALLHHVAKAGVECDGEYSGAKTSLETARDVEFVGKEDGSGIGRPPQDGLIVAVPGEDPMAVGFEQPLWSQIASDSEQALRVG